MFVKKIFFPLFISLFCLSSFAYANSAVRVDITPEYDFKRDPAQDLKQVMRLAQKEKKRIWVCIGRNDCVWSNRLETFIRENKDLDDYIRQHFVMLRVYYGKKKDNNSFFKQYKKVPATPHFYILDNKGKLIVDQDTTFFEFGRHYEKELLFYFFKKYSGKEKNLIQPKVEYDKRTDILEEVNLLKKKAKKEEKKIMVIAGERSCPWCRMILDFAETDKEVSKYIKDKFFLITASIHPESQASVFFKDHVRPTEYPHIYFFDENGKYIKDQRTAPLERGAGYDTAKFLSALKHIAEDKKAEQSALPKFYDSLADADLLFKKAIEISKKEKKNILTIIGSASCGWCHALDEFVEKTKDIKSFMDKNFVVLKISVNHNKFIAKHGSIKGTPHFFVFDKNGKLLNSSSSDKFEEKRSYSHDKLFAFLKKMAK